MSKNSQSETESNDDRSSENCFTEEADSDRGLSDNEVSTSTNGSEIKIDFGMEIELTSAYDKERIRSYYKCVCGQFNDKAFDEMEMLFNTDPRKFVLYRNIVACFANGLDSSLIAELFHKAESLLFVVEEKSENSWSLQSSSAFVGTKNFVMMVNWDNPSIKRFNMEFDEETLRRVFQTPNEPFSMINEKFQVTRRMIIKFDDSMIVNWKQNEVEIYSCCSDAENNKSNFRILGSRDNDEKLTAEEREKLIPTIESLMNQIQAKCSGGAPKYCCLYPKCSYKDHKYKLLQHYVLHNEANRVLLTNWKKKPKQICHLCGKMLLGLQKHHLNRHLKSIHKKLMCSLCIPPLLFSSKNYITEHKRHLFYVHSRLTHRKSC